MLYFIGGLALLALGITMFFKPQLFYELAESWKHAGGSEPSRLWVTSTKSGGVMCMLAGVAGLAVPFIS